MNIERERIALTRCVDGVQVSTIYLPGLNRAEGDYETCLLGADFTVAEVACYTDEEAAFAGHARFVHEHGGVAPALPALVYIALGLAVAAIAVGFFSGSHP